jgi:cell shape-determining protein MreC
MTDLGSLAEEVEFLREKLRRKEEECDSISEQLAKENARWRRLRLILKEHMIDD